MSYRSINASPQAIFDALTYRDEQKQDFKHKQINEFEVNEPPIEESPLKAIEKISKSRAANARAEYCIIAVVFLIFLVGCLSLPSAKQSAAEKKIEKINQQIEKNDDGRMEAIKNYSYAANYSLNLDPNPSKYNILAENLTDKVLVVSGPPKAQQVREFRSIVEGITSTNKEEIAKAQKRLDIKDNEVIRLQNELQTLNTKLDKQEQDNKILAQKNASLADVWFKARRILLWAMWIVIVLVVMHVLSLILPPPYSSAFGIVSLIFGTVAKFLFSMAPKAKEMAKVVGDQTQKTLEHVVNSIEEVKISYPEAFEKLKPVLQKNTDDISKEAISTVIHEQKFA